MVDYIYKDLFSADDTDVKIHIVSGATDLTNSDIYGESLSLTESLCDNDSLLYGSVEASKLTFITNSNVNLLNRVIEVSFILNNHDEAPFALGTYRVANEKISADRTQKTIEAYDDVYFWADTNVADWYNGLVFPISIKNMRDSLFTYLEVEQDEATLCNDDIMVQKTIESEVISAISVIRSICEINGVFGRIGRDGHFKYIEYVQTGEGLHPTMGLYPETGLYPSNGGGGGSWDTEDLNTSEYSSLSFEDFTTSKPNKLQIREEEDDVGVVVGSGNNCYVIQGNFLCFGMDSDELLEVATNVFPMVKSLTYTPCKVVCQGNPCVEVGDGIDITRTDGTVCHSVIMKRTFKGINAFTDTYESKGTELLEEVNDLNSEIKQILGKSNVLTRTVEGLTNRVTDIEDGSASVIQQLSNRITLKVSKGDVSNELSSEVGEITIDGNRLVVNADNFSLTAQGDLYTKNSLKMFSNIRNQAETIMAFEKGSTRSVAEQTIDLRPLIQFWEYIPAHKETDYAAVLNSCAGVGLIKQTFHLQHDFQGQAMVNDEWFDLDDYYTHGANYILGETYIQDSDDVLGGTSYGNLHVSGSIYADGTKYRVIKTEHYGKRGLSAYETAEPYFGDIGESNTGANGEVFIPIEEIFSETVSLSEYQVFLQAYGEGTLYISNRSVNGFRVKGTPNLSFAWEIKARQKDYTDLRLEEVK